MRPASRWLDSTAVRIPNDTEAYYSLLPVSLTPGNWPCYKRVKYAVAYNLNSDPISNYLELLAIFANLEVKSRDHWTQAKYSSGVTVTAVNH